MKTDCSAAYCMKHLTPTQYVVYQGLCELWCGGPTGASLDEISNASGISKKSVWEHMARIQKKGFVVYTTRQSNTTVLLWVRLGEQEVPPKTFRYVSTTRLKDPYGTIHTVKYGNMNKFCKEHGLQNKCIYALINHTQKHHHGWTLVSAG